MLIDLKATFKEMKDLKMTWNERYFGIERSLFIIVEYYSKHSTDFDKGKYVRDLMEEAVKIRDEIALGIKQGRDGYPFYKEDTNKINKKKKGFRENSRKILAMLKDHDFEVFYKVFPIKDKLK